MNCSLQGHLSVVRSTDIMWMDLKDTKVSDIGTGSWLWHNPHGPDMLCSISKLFDNAPGKWYPGTHSSQTFNLKVWRSLLFFDFFLNLCKHFTRHDLVIHESPCCCWFSRGESRLLAQLANHYTPEPLSMYFQNWVIRGGHGFSCLGWVINYLHEISRHLCNHMLY